MTDTWALIQSLHRIIVALLLFAASALLHAGANDIEVSDAWVRATVPGQQVAGAYMEITAAKGGKLVKVETPAAKTAEIHSMAMDQGVMRMRAMDALPLPKGETVKLAPGGYHLMLTGLKQPLRPGDSVALRLTVQTADGEPITLQVSAPVRAAAP